MRGGSQEKTHKEYILLRLSTDITRFILELFNDKTELTRNEIADCCKGKWNHLGRGHVRSHLWLMSGFHKVIKITGEVVTLD